MSANIIAELTDLDRCALIDLVNDKNKQIQELEQLLEDQKRLRLQDSSQVEEKAAKIKEWVTKKLKELENQNKQLKDQNKKQKEIVESLSSKLATMSPISMSPMRRQIINSTNINYEQPQQQQVIYIDQTIPPASALPITDTLDVNQSLKIRRPQLKHKLQINQPKQQQQNHYYHQNISTKDTGVSLVPISQSNTNINNNIRQSQFGKESPLYDTVSIDTSILTSSLNNSVTSQHYNQHQNNNIIEPTPPPLPLHQSDKWEQNLYNLAEQTFSSLTKEVEANCKAVSDQQRQSLRESSAMLKESLKSFVKPSYTTIDGDKVIDDEDQSDVEDEREEEDSADRDHGMNNLSYQLDNLNQRRQSKINQARNLDSIDCNLSTKTTTIDKQQQQQQQQLNNNLFSPVRSRLSSKDCNSILRTQSVRKNPTPEKLFEFMAADLVKRGYLIKHGALRCHQRWFVLKNFHLYSYKRESDETDKLNPSMTLKLDTQIQLQIIGHNSDGYSFKINTNPLNNQHHVSLTLIAETAQLRDEWIKILTIAIQMSDIEPYMLTKHYSKQEGLLLLTRQGNSKRCHAMLVSHLVFFLKSPIDPTPLGYISVKQGKIREVTDIQDGQLQDCSLAIYPRYSINLDPVYITLANQQETDEWFQQLSLASGLDQASGTQFERILIQLMLNNNDINHQIMPATTTTNSNLDNCMWPPVTLYNDKPILEPLTSLPNETLKIEALELSKSIILFTQVPIQPVAIDYHVCLLQNCLGRLLKYPELRNEFYAQLIKQSTYVRHRCFESKLSSSSSSSGCSSIIINNQRSSMNSLSPSTSDCQLITDLQLLDDSNNSQAATAAATATMYQSQTMATNEGLGDNSPPLPLRESGGSSCPTRRELLQVMQIISLAISLNLPRGRMRWWLEHHLNKFANSETNLGKYALYAIKALKRTIANGSRDTIPSRTEIMGILLRNPYDHSTPHSLPVHFDDNSYLIVGTDGSTTVEEFMISMSKRVNIRASQLSDFYLFASDPNESKNILHILEPQRKILDVVGWWEQTFKQQNSGRYQNTRVIKLYCKKRLVLRCEEGETEQERLLIVHQLNHEVVFNKIPISDALIMELSAILTQLKLGDFSKFKEDNDKMLKCIKTLMPSSRDLLAKQVVERWRSLSGISAQDCVRVYLNCIRKLKL